MLILLTQGNDLLSQRMRQTIIDVLRLERRYLMHATFCCHIRIRIVLQAKDEIGFIYHFYILLTKRSNGYRPKPAMELIQISHILALANLQQSHHILIKVFKQLLAGILHRCLDTHIHFLLNLVEGSVDFLWGATLLIDVEHPLLEVNTRLDATQHFITRTEDTIKEMEFLRKQLEHTHISCICLVNEVENHHIILLSITMASTYALFHPLRIPRQIIIHNKRTKLKVDTFGCRLGSNHDFGFVSEIIYNSLALVCRQRRGKS